MITKCNQCGADVNAEETREIIEGAIGDAICVILRECPNDELAQEVIKAMRSLQNQVKFTVDEVKLSLQQLQMIQKALRAGRYGHRSVNPFVEGLES